MVSGPHEQGNSSGEEPPVVASPVAAGLRGAWRARRLRRLGRICLGVFCVLVGIAGLVLPVLQGVVTIVIGLVLLAPDVGWVRRILVSALRRWPSLRRRLPARVRRLMRGGASEGEPDG